jgi:DNA-binding HxlR family transcriptional regulator
MVLLDLLGRRWALRILWELREGAETFRSLRERCDGVSPTVLNERLRELRENGIVTHADEGFDLTRSGKALLRALQPLNRWAEERLRNERTS